jgi:tetratricopeptide (TPR) repeat protein
MNTMDIEAKFQFASVEDAVAVASSLATVGQTHAALMIYRDIRSSFPDRSEGYRYAITLLTRTGQLDAAFDLLRQAGDRFPDDPGFLIDHGWLALQRRDLDAAAAHWAIVRGRLASHPAGYVGGGITFRELNRLDEADQLLRIAVDRFPKDAGAVIEYARIAQRRNDWPEALRRWEAVTAAFPDRTDGLTGAATVLAELGRLQEAEQRLASAMSVHPGDPACAIEYARVAARRKDVQAAASRWQHVRDLFPARPEAYIGGAQALRDLGRFDDADALLRDAMGRFPNESGPVFEYAWLAHIRRDWPQAIERWAEVRNRYPDVSLGYTRGAEALRTERRFTEADDILRKAVALFPAESGPLTEFAWLAVLRRDFEEAINRWDAVRLRFPNLVSAYVDALHPLRELNRWADAELLLLEATLRFPDAFAPPRELATLALRRRDWAKAARLFAVLRDRFPREAGSYGGGILALRELHRFEEAEAVSLLAMERFPAEAGFRLDHAWLSMTARDWPNAIQRWAKVRELLPDRLEPYVQGSRALREAWRHADAEALLADGIIRFPGNADLVAEHAWLAMGQNRWDEAAVRFQIMRERFPNRPDGWQGGAAILRNQFELKQAEAMLEQAMSRFPDQPQFALDHAQLPIAPAFAEQKDWPETLRRLDRLHAKFPSFETGLIVGARLFKDARLPERAEALVVSGSLRMPDSYALAVLAAEAALDRQDWPLAITRCTDVKNRFPDQPGGDIGLARALAGEKRFAEADDLLLRTIARFPGNTAPLVEAIDLAMAQENWATALQRANDAMTRFPQEKQFAQRAYDARMRLSEGDSAAAVAFAQMAPAPMPDPDSADQQVRNLVMQFESLGGRGLGCEFGIFQRDCGAEPLGLLRWADMPYDMLLATLRNRFEGVGTPEQTELFISAVGGGRGEYCTRDRRGMMFMRAFVYEDQASFDRMQVSSLNRLRFLTRKLIEDLETGSKIFVFRLTDRNLTGAEIDDLHAAMRSYGDNTLLYVRYEDDAHPNGTVEAVKPGLLIGHMDRFKLSPSNQLSSAPATASWLAVCRNAYALWRSAA